MTEEFQNTATDYLLGTLEGEERAAFEAQIERFPGARAAVAECADVLQFLGRQALDVPFLGRVVRSEINSVMQAARERARRDFHRGAFKVRQLVARHA